MTLFFLNRSLQKAIGLLALTYFFQIQAIVEIPIHDDFIVTGNPGRVERYIDSLKIQGGSDLAHVLCELPIDPVEFVSALDELHPAPLQDITFATNENMQAVRQAFTGRNAYLRFGRCIKFEGLYNHCNLGPSSLWITPLGVFNNQAHIGGQFGYRSSSPGIAIGVDSQPNKTTIVGFGLGYTFTDLHWKAQHGDADWHTGYFGMYATKLCNNFYFDAAVLGSYEFYKTKRHINFRKFNKQSDDFYKKPKENKCASNTGRCGAFVKGECHEKRHRDNCCRFCQLDEDGHGEFNKDCCLKPPPKCLCEIKRHPRSRYRGYAILTHVGAGCKLHLCGVNIIPFASLDYDFVDQDGHREYHGRGINNRIKANHAHLLRGESGITLSSCIPYNCTWFRPSITVSYIRKSILQGNRFTARFVKYNRPERDYSVYGTKGSSDYVAAGFGLDTQFSTQYIVSFNYDAELSRQRQVQRVSCLIQRAY